MVERFWLYFPYDYTVEVRNRFKGLDLIDRVPDELRTEVCDIVQEKGIKTIPKKKKWQKCKMVVWGDLTNRWEKKRNERQRRKGKIYPPECTVPENSRRDNKAFLCEQFKEKKIEWERLKISSKSRDSKGIFHAKVGTIKDGNGMEWTETEAIKKRWQEYTEELYKNDLNDQNNYDGVITHLEQNIQASLRAKIV